MAVKKAKVNRVQVILECTEMKESGLPGTSRYITTKNRKNTPERLELKKYNPILRRMTIHKEIKETPTVNHGKENSRYAPRSTTPFSSERPSTKKLNTPQ